MTVFYYKGWTQDQTKKEIFRVRSRKFTNIKLPHPLPVQLGHMTLLALQYGHQRGNWPNLSRILTVVVQSLSRVWFFATPWTTAHQASLSFTVSRSLLKLMSIESVMPSNNFILCHPLVFLGSFCQVAKVLELQLQTQSFQWIFRVDFFRIDWFLLGFHSVGMNTWVIDHVTEFSLQLFSPLPEVRLLSLDSKLHPSHHIVGLSRTASPNPKAIKGAHLTHLISINVGVVWGILLE